MYIYQAAAGIHFRLFFDENEFPTQTVTENKPLSEINKKIYIVMAKFVL